MQINLKISPNFVIVPLVRVSPGEHHRLKAYFKKINLKKSSQDVVIPPRCSNKCKEASTGLHISGSAGAGDPFRESESFFLGVNRALYLSSRFSRERFNNKSRSQERQELLLYSLGHSMTREAPHPDV